MPAAPPVGLFCAYGWRCQEDERSSCCRGRPVAALTKPRGRICCCTSGGGIGGVWEVVTTADRAPGAELEWPDAGGSGSAAGLSPSERSGRAHRPAASTHDPRVDGWVRQHRHLLGAELHRDKHDLVEGGARPHQYLLQSGPLVSIFSFLFIFFCCWRWCAFRSHIGWTVYSRYRFRYIRVRQLC